MLFDAFFTECLIIFYNLNFILLINLLIISIFIVNLIDFPLIVSIDDFGRADALGI